MIFFTGMTDFNFNNSHKVQKKYWKFSNLNPLKKDENFPAALPNRAL